MKKILIVDDESSARKLIKEYLEVYTAFKIVGEANNGLTAVKLINELEPDLVFLDIMMPGLDGFEVLGKLNFIPKIIFSTDRKSTRLNSSHSTLSRMPSSA